MLSFFKSWSTTQRLTISFLIVIAIGSFLLWLPVTHYSNAPATTYLDHLFNAVSMVCVTGLSTVPVATVYNGLGQIIVMCLMQIGGLGIVSLLAISMFSLKHRINLSEQTLLQSALSKESSNNLRGYLFSVYKITFAFEAIAVLILMVDFVPRYGLRNGSFNAVFLAISAFCNAGFDNLGSISLQDFILNPLVNFTVAFLIIAGGLGFAVWIDLGQAARRFWKEKPHKFSSAFRPLSNQSRLVLRVTGIILLLGTLLAWIMEINNSQTIANYSGFQQFMISFFQSVTMRTAGFSTLSYLNTHVSTDFLYMIQMIVGGAPGGTAGGIKVTTIAITFLLVKSELTGQSEVTFRHRMIASKTIKQTLIVIIFFFLVLISGYVLLLQAEPDLDPIGLLFESISAIDTVGVSMDITAKLSTAGRLIIMALMFIGRVGPTTVLLSLLQKKEKNIRYPKTNISVG